jgi:hypothetical protein
VSQGALLPDDAPAWQRHFHGDGHGYRWLLVLILASLGFQMAAPDTELARLAIILFQGFTLIAALVVSGVRRWLIHVVAAITVVAIAPPSASSSARASSTSAAVASSGSCSPPWRRPRSWSGSSARLAGPS